MSSSLFHFLSRLFIHLLLLYLARPSNQRVLSTISFRITSFRSVHLPYLGWHYLQRVLFTDSFPFTIFLSRSSLLHYTFHSNQRALFTVLSPVTISPFTTPSPLSRAALIVFITSFSLPLLHSPSLLPYQGCHSNQHTFSTPSFSFQYYPIHYDLSGSL